MRSGFSESGGGLQGDVLVVGAGLHGNGAAHVRAAGVCGARGSETGSKRNLQMQRAALLLRPGADLQPQLQGPAHRLRLGPQLDLGGLGGSEQVFPGLTLFSL